LDVTQGVKQTEAELRRIFERIGDLTGKFDRLRDYRLPTCIR
jgi:hypothetical protein